MVFRKSYHIEGGNFQSAGSVSKKIKQILKQLNIDGEIIWRAMIVAYEAEMNVVLYASEAEVILEISPKKICMIFKDKGPGIPDIPLAMTEGYSTATREMRERGFGAGLGLPNIKKTADNFDIQSTVGSGTQLIIDINIF
ncbi:anti-sigma regulatory factor [bacterium]|nr:anti-sigma regulatory factor [candidate division CSSED10-310 bacterium]